MNPSKENRQRALEMLEDQSVFLQGEMCDFIRKFLTVALRKLPREESFPKPAKSEERK